MWPGIGSAVGDLRGAIDELAAALMPLTGAAPDIAKLEQQLRTWQTSVLESLTGADYR